MRNLILFAAAFALTVSCNNAQPEAAKETTSGTTDAAAKPAIAAKIDPICEMEYDASWTEYTVYNNDTIHFCSETCKKGFLAHPEKYVKATAQ